MLFGRIVDRLDVIQEELVQVKIETVALTAPKASTSKGV